MATDDKLSSSIKHWDFDDVKEWLNEKGYDDSVQNKFFDEKIDGEALLLLKGFELSDFMKELKITLPLGYRLKLKSYIHTLHRNGYQSNKERKNYNNHNHDEDKKETETDRDRDRNKNKNIYNDGYRNKHNQRSHSQNNIYSSNNNANTNNIVNDLNLPHTNLNTIAVKKIKPSISNNKNNDNDSNGINRKRKRAMIDLTDNNSDISIYENNPKKKRRKLNHEKPKRNKQNETNLNYSASKITSRYSNNNEHDTRNGGKLWTEKDKQIAWRLHEKGMSNKLIAKRLHRTECGVMVLINAIYKNKKHNKETKIQNNKKIQITNSIIQREKERLKLLKK